MAETTEIAWTDSTFNPWIGCQHVSPGCDGCYAEELMDTRYGRVEWGPHGERSRTSADTWRNPRRWNAKADAFQRIRGRRQRVFCASLCDWLDNQVPREWRRDLLELIDATPNLDWQMLTKRPEMARKLVPDDGWGRPHVWFGITGESQEYYDHRWPIAASIPARVRFVSYEPAVGPLDLGAPPFPDWVIVGGESGKRARLFELGWARAIVAQCRALDVAVFVKQMGDRPVEGGKPIKFRAPKGGDMAEWPVDLRVREFPQPVRPADLLAFAYAAGGPGGGAGLFD